MRYTIITILALLVASCSHHPDTVKGTSPRGVRQSLTRRAWEMRRAGEPLDSIIKVQRIAVEELREGRSSDDPVETLEQMGCLYGIAGDFTSALKFYLEASDSLKARPVSDRNDGAIQLFGDLSSLYAFLGMTEQALEYSDSAIAESKRQKGIMLSDVYRFRAGIYELANDIPAATQCYRLAIEAVDKGNTRSDKNQLRNIILVEKAHLLLSAYPDDPDSVAWAVNTLENTSNPDDIDDTDRVYALGIGYVIQGRPDMGLPLLHKAAESFRRQDDIERINVVNSALLETYARYRMDDSLATLVPQYLEDSDSFIRAQQSNALIGAMVKYDMRSTQDRNRILTLQLEVERERRTINFGIAVIVILALLCCSVIFYLRNRLLNQKRMLQEKELVGLSESNNLLNRRVDVLEKDLSAGMNSNGTILSSPQLITGKEEGRFRRAFNVLYPDFISQLKLDYPRLTPNDELLCMLLYLKHTTEEISVYLGISRASVNSARYRLRTKFALPKDMDLDSFLTSRKG